MNKDNSHSWVRISYGTVKYVIDAFEDNTEILAKISDLLSYLGQTPATFTVRILFMSMINDISCDRNDNKDECLKKVDYVKTFARRFGIGQWSFVGRGSEKK